LLFFVGVGRVYPSLFILELGAAKITKKTNKEESEGGRACAWHNS
jgi:uncharacterized protein Veg